MASVGAIAAGVGIAAAAGGILGALSKDPTLRQTLLFDPNIRAAINAILASGKELFGREFTGTFIAGATPAEEQGLLDQLKFFEDPRIEQLSRDFSENLLRSAGEIGSLANLDPEKNRALRAQFGVIDTELERALDIREQEFATGASRFGTAGGGRDILQRELAFGETQDARAIAQAELLQNERNLITQAPGLFQAGLAAGAAPGAAKVGIGTQQRDLRQLGLNESLAQFLFPQQQLGAFSNIVGGFLPGLATGSTKTLETDIFTKILKGASGGAGIAASAFGAAGGVG